MFKIIVILLILSSISITYAADPVAHYKFKDTGVGGDYPGNIIDDTLNGHDGIAYNTSYTKGIIDNALEFDGPYSYVEVPDAPVFSFTNGMEDYDYSISFWCKGSNYTNIVFVSKGHFTDDHEYTCYTGSKGQIYFYMKDSDHVLGNFKYGRTEKTLSDYTLEWLNVVVTHGPANKVNIFVNGEYWNTYEYLGVNYTSMNDGPDNITVGQVNSFTGIIEMDEVKIWNSYLTTTEISNLYKEMRDKYYTLTLISRDIFTSKNNFSVYENEKYIGTYSYEDTFNITDMRDYTIIIHEDIKDRISDIEQIDDIAFGSITYIIYIILFIGIIALLKHYYRKF